METAMRDQCLLTTKDFTLLEAVIDDPFVRDSPLRPLMERKMAAATVVFRQDLPEDAASLNSRITFSIDGRRDTRILTTGRMTTPVGMLLPVDTLRGLALLGLREGQKIIVENADGFQEQVLLEAVNFQPERAMKALDGPQVRMRPVGKPMLRLLKGGAPCRQRPAPEKPEDPGPSAA